MAFTMLGNLWYLRVIVMQIGYLMLMRFIAQVDIMFTLGEQSMRFRRSIDTHERPGV